MSKIKELDARKKALIKQMEEYSLAYRQGLLNKEDYLHKKFELLDGRFEDHVVNELDSEINVLRGKKRVNVTVIVAVLLLGLMIPMIDFSGLTGLSIFDPGNESVLPVNELYTTNSTRDFTFINTTSLKASGKIHGFGETWIYLQDGNTTKLVYYADTRPQGLTGMVVGGPNATEINGSDTPSNGTVTNETNNVTETNTTENQTTNTTVNETNSTSSINETNTTTQTNSTNTTTNTTVNETETNTTVNETGNVTTNVTTNTTTNTTVNETNTTLPPVVEEFEPEIITDKDTYSIGERVELSVRPEGSSYTLYLHTPTNTYLLGDDYWITVEPGNHTLTSLITLNNNTERVSKTFYVRNVGEEVTATFTGACVETCSMPETSVNLLIVVDGTQLYLDNMTYVASERELNVTNGTKQNVSEPEYTPQELEQIEILRQCLPPNPNARPSHCFTQEEKEKKFPEKNFTLVNSLGMQMAVFDHLGNMHIKGGLVEYSYDEPKEFDFIVRRADETAAAWVDAITGDLHLAGRVIEDQDTLMWESRQDYVISNTEGMYLAVFNANTGDLYLRGEINQVN